MRAQSRRLLWGLGVLWATGLLWTAVCTAASPGGIGGTGITRGGIGGTGISPGGIGGTGIVAVGPIQRFGSIFVNGTEYALPAETRYQVDGHAASEHNLHLGDLVAVRAQVQADKVMAVEVAVDHAIVGKITHIDSAQARLRVLGQSVQIMQSTILRTAAEQPMTLADLKVGDSVQISALRQDGAHWQALRVQRLSVQPGAQQSPFLLRGRLDAVDAATGRIEVNGVWFPAREAPQKSALTVGGNVVVRGVQGPAGDMVESVVMQSPVAGEAGLHVILVGYLHAQPSADITLHGLRLQATTASALHQLRTTLSERAAPAVIIGTLQPDQTVVVDQIIPRVNPMVFALPPQIVQPAVNGVQSSALHAPSSPETSGWIPLQSGMPTSAPQVPFTQMPSLPAIPGGVSPTLTVPVMPQVAPTLPAVTTPSITPPTVTAPSVPTVPPPSVTAPTVPTPTVPTVTSPSVTPPSVPSVAPPTVTTPAAPAVTPSPITMPTVPSPSLPRP